MKRYLRAGWIRVALTSACVTLLLAGATGCWLFNVPPTAAFTVSAQAGQAPFTVNFSAVLSEDEDGEIVEFKWDFGDGTSGVGETVSKTYEQAGTFTVVLRVTDDRGASATTSKNIYVTPAEPPGPSASFTVSPSSGTSPLTVNVNASASSYPAGVIAQYEWDWGDGGTTTGVTASRSYFVTNTTTFTITLTVRATDGKVGTATQTVTVNAAGTTPGPGPAPNAPSARFDINIDRGVAPLQVTFDPSDSKAAEGRSIILYTWSFGDGSATSEINPVNKTHVYTTSSPSQVFSVTLLVLDNQGASNTITKTVRVYNHRPVAGFEIWDPAIPDWSTDDQIQVETLPGAANVTIRSRQIPIGGLAEHWHNRKRSVDGLDAVLYTQAELQQARGVLATSSTAPTAPPEYADNNFSYDPEGQRWLDGPPAWFPVGTGPAWGIRWLDIDWGYPGGQTRLPYDDPLNPNNQITHDYLGAGPVHGDVYTITVIAEDYLGHRSAPFSRKVEFRVP